MSLPVPNPKIFELDHAEITVGPWSWTFAIEHRDEIARHFARLQRERPGVWNGRVLLLNRYVVDGSVLRGACFETEYANLCALRDWNMPNPAVYNVFAAAALQAADDAYLLGEMGPDTATAGRLYFPCGTPEPDDIDGAGRLDIAGNLQRELKEETGLDIGELEAATGWSVVIDRCHIALLKRLKAHQSAEELRSRIMRFLASERKPEFVDIRIVRGPGDLDARMPKFVTAFIEQSFRKGHTQPES